MHVRLHRWLLQSQAWKSLSLAARCLLIELYDEHNGDNNGYFFMGVRTAAERLGVGKNLANRSFQELEDRGFIRARQRGSFNLKVRHATQWILTEYGFAGQPATKDFMRWPQSGMQKPVPNGGTNGPPCEDNDPPPQP